MKFMSWNTRWELPLLLMFAIAFVWICVHVNAYVDSPCELRWEFEQKHNIEGNATFSQSVRESYSHLSAIEACAIVED